MEFKKNILNLLDFIHTSPTPFHAVLNMKEKLLKKKFVELKENQKWNLTKGGKYFINKDDSGLIAFVVGSGNLEETGFKIVTSHTDSPCLKIKLNSENIQNGYNRVVIEVYGGLILSTYVDRELSIAGRVIVKENDNLITKFVNFNKPVAIIPNVAIHMNRDINDGFVYDKQNHLQPILGASSLDAGQLKLNIAKELNTTVENIYEADLMLYDTHKGNVVGFNEDMIISPRLDNLAMCHASLEAILNVKNPVSTDIAIFFDSEEIGSLTTSGANSVFLGNILERISNLLNDNSKESYFVTLANSFIISADMAHAVHPNYPEKHDKFYAPVLNGGLVIKMNGECRYSSTSQTVAFIENICKKNNIKYQKFINHSNIKAGTTVGPITAAKLGVNAVDVGNPMFAMHSIRETAGVTDHTNMIELFNNFYK